MYAAAMPALDLDADESRVYFGPFMSPEKKYLGPGLAVPKPMTPSPLRRSPRLSSPIPNWPGQTADAGEGGNPDEQEEEEEEEEEEEGLSRSRSGTPDNDRWQQDEPSSVLATRITRAHDNPSPPPAAPVNELDSSPPTPVLYPSHPIPFVIPVSPSPLSRGGSPSASRPPRSPHQHDLISFDSFSTPTELLPTHPVASTSFVPIQPQNPSVDELLSSWSPSARDIPAASVSPPPSDAEASSSTDKAKRSDELTPEAAEEQAVANALILSDAMDPVRCAPPFQSDSTNADPQPSDGHPPHTPLRRSTRPRRSTTPHAHLVPLPSSDDEQSPARTHLTPSSAVTKKKRRKGTEGNTLVSYDSNKSQSSETDLPNGPSTSEADRETKRRRERKQAAANGAPDTLLHRQLGSLSPGSANLLTQLLPPSRPSPLREQEETQPPFSFSAFPVANPAHATPVRISSPVRASPERRAKPRSPNRIQFQPPSLNDPNRTPARRIPVEQAVARGQISPQKGAQLLANNLDTRAPVFHIRPQDSPARRVTVAPPSADQGKWQGMRFGSPTRGRSRERSGSVEPKPPWNGSGTTAGPSDLGSSASKTRSSPSRPIAAPIKKGNLPFPLTPSGSDCPVPIPEMGESVLSSSTDAPPPPPVLGIIKVPRSNLKQPTSRIPRIGTKPYARPAAKPTSDKAAKAPATTRKTVETAREPPSKIKVARTGSGSSSDDMKSSEAGPSTLKRKRAPSPQARPRPVVLLRQVAPTKYAPKPVPVQAPPSPVKRPAVAKFRMVDLHARPIDVDPKPADTAMPAEPAPGPEAIALDTLRLPPMSSPIASSPVPPPAEELASDPPPLDVSEPVRRTTRLRKSVFPASVGPPQPLPTRRKVSQQPPSGSGVFAGMNATALRALTSSNTTKNQKYLAAKLETEVVRKEGARPESPAVKIRTIAQREQEEKTIQRKARAARRAQRNEDGFSEGEESTADTFSDMDSSPLRRHRRGPGDEEDYETPNVHGAKRARAGSVSGEGEYTEKKRVKWHRGLSTAVYLDEVEPRTKARPKENLVTKGCLASTAKAIRLDPLGNHPNAELPLQDLIEENIVVKKFVYDNDEPITAVNEEPITPVIVVKNTRSKAKKKT